MNVLRTLGSVLHGIETGKSFQTSETPAREDQLGVLKVSAVTWSSFRPEQAKAVVNHVPEEHHRVRAGDLLISRANTRELVGAVVLVERDYPLRLLSDKTLRLLVDQDQAEPAYLLYALRTGAAREHIEKNATGTSDSMRNISQDVITSAPIVLPPIAEQRRIASRLKDQLSAAQDAREAAQAQFNEIRALARSLYREIEADLFGRAERCIFGDWVVSYRNGFGRRPKIGETGPIVLRIADVSSGVINLAAPRRGEVSAKEAATYALNLGDLVFVRVNGTKKIVGRCCVVNDQVPSGTIFNDHLIRVQLRDGLNPDYARLCATLPSARAAIEDAASTSAGQLTVNQQILDAIEFPSLPLEEQINTVRQVNAQLGAVMEIQQAAQQRLADLDRLPTRLLHAAFTPALGAELDVDAMQSECAKKNATSGTGSHAATQ